MKKIGLYICVLLLLLTSCADSFLDTKSPSQQSSENVFKSTFFTEAAMQGLYSMLTSSNIYSNKITTGWLNNSDIEFSTLKYFTNTASNNYATANYYSTKNTDYSGTWGDLYRVIEMSTTAVEGIRKSPLMMTRDSVLMKSYLGEALTIRSLGYLELIKIWGDVPFRRTSSNADNIYDNKCDRDTIYKYILKDLIEAQNYLPWMGKSKGGVAYTAERITKGFAKGLAARVALYAGGWSVRDANQFPYQTITLLHHPEIAEMNNYFVGRVKNYKEYYAIAAQQCAEIIGDAENPHQLDSYEELWRSINKLSLNAKNENLFEIAMGMGQNGDIGSLIGVNLADGTSYGSRGLGGNNVKTSIYYFYSFDSLDVRRDITLTNINYTADLKYYKGGVGLEGEAFGNTITDWNFAKWRYNWMNSSYLALVKASATTRIGTGVNFVVMRYSDVLLMFAEAQNELSGPDAVNAKAQMSGRKAFEKVRARAFPTNAQKITNYSSDFFDALVNERAWEFGCEAIRKFDLIRWGLLSKKIEEQKEALCLMINGNKDVKIFDKYYPAGSLPTTVYYRYETGKNTIDRSSINWLGAPKSTTLSTTWLSEAAGGKNLVTNAKWILLSSSGIDAHYDCSAIIQKLDSANSIQNAINLYAPLGNSVCNYRHPFAITATVLLPTNGTLVNSYGY